LLYREYIEKELPAHQVAERLGGSKTTILTWLEKHKIPIRPNLFSLTGKKSVGWKGGKYTNAKGYVFIYSPNHPNKIRKDKKKFGPGGYVAEHRLVMEKHLGRYLFSWEMPHHKNGIKNDNRIENLELLPNEKHNTRVQEVYKENLFLKQQLANFMSIKV